MKPFEQTSQLVSVIIPCYNQGHYLAEAVHSVIRQTWSAIEIIVVDDGSTDHTRAVAMSFPQVRYYYQKNSGLASARNTGISHSNGHYLVFLDADDILYPEGIERNLEYLIQHPDCFMVSGSHDKTDAWLCPLPDQTLPPLVTGNHYAALLAGNYIGMHAAVMYRAEIFQKLQFDSTLKAAEDYDMYLRIARSYTVGTHPHKIAAYRRHGANMSSRQIWMLRHVLLVHRRQQILLQSAEELASWRQGRRIWRRYYAEELLARLVAGMRSDTHFPGIPELRLLAVERPVGLGRYLIKKSYYTFRTVLKQMLPAGMADRLRQTRLYHGYTPPPGKIVVGDFARMRPFSSSFGFDRGGAVDRFYIESFLEDNAHRVRGRVLEIGDNTYTFRYGGSKVTRSDVLHIHEGNGAATLIGDLTNIPQVPSATFDCIILTQTLHLIYDFKSALRTCHRILKPGGCLLLTVPGISHIDQGEWRDHWLWSFTASSIRRMLSEVFSGSGIQVKAYGNVFVAAAFLYGMGLTEFRRDYLLSHDPSYQVIIAAKAMKK